MSYIVLSEFAALEPHMVPGWTFVDILLIHFVLAFYITHYDPFPSSIIYRGPLDFDRHAYVYVQLWVTH